MPIVVGLAVLAALIYGAVWSFDALDTHFGMGVAVGVAVVVAALIVAAVLYWLRRRREVAPNIHDGDWTHEVKGEWGMIRLAAGKRLCEIRVAGEQGAYIFADLQGAEATPVGEQWKLTVKVRDTKHPVWEVPMRDKGQAAQWQRMFGLAVQQKL
ncbi:hypothetical protein [Paraburkholderia sp. DHOC27]|uniref:hypothetical protein n=1 Tax=Paraburkholderia sp. DHOC27 TaxID=2303330 RepID=UPI000E3D80A4|nr:hypothetical protein [Paraburkholderia sp. DHOC27]RFU48045.1 hypothetical protein D0B32_11030 [Paraburkholderia sp. DHOC27]